MEETSLIPIMEPKKKNRITCQQAEEILIKYFKDNVEMEDLGEQYNLTRTSILNILKGKTFSILKEKHPQYFYSPLSYLKMEVCEMPVFNRMDAVEIWKPIQNYEGKYEVSNFGNVRSLVDNKLQIRSEPYYLTQRRDKDGYLKVTLSSSIFGGKDRLVHRIVAQTFIPNPENKAFVDHQNRNRANNRADNLKWVTKDENAKLTTLRGGREKSVEQCQKRSLIDENQALLILFLKETGLLNSAQISRALNVSKNTIFNIYDSFSWKNLIGLPYQQILKDRQAKIFKPIEEYRK